MTTNNTRRRSDRRPRNTCSRRGTLRVNARGFAFCDFDTPVEHGDDLITSAFVPGHATAGFLDGDLVTVAVTVEGDGRASAGDLTLRQRTRSELFGIVEEVPTGEQPGTLLLDPHLGHGPWPVTDPEDTGVQVGDAVIVLVGAPDAPLVIDENFGPARTGTGKLTVEALSVMALTRHQLPRHDPAGDSTVTLSPAGGRRRDLRTQPTFTIDADHSRDLDDALSFCGTSPAGHLVAQIHIADVAQHVPAGSPLDLEARHAATSIYLPGVTRPMLPRNLSEQALSLLPGQDRDTLTVELHVDADGHVVASDVFESRTRSNLRLSYVNAAAILAGRPRTPDPVTGVDPVADADFDLTGHLQGLHQMAERLNRQRSSRGGFQVERTDPGLPGRPAPDRSEQLAHDLIEALMVAANETIAAWLQDADLPGLWRTHQAPGAEACEELTLFGGALGVNAELGEQLTPRNVADLADKVAAVRPDALPVLSEILLSHATPATYQPTPGEHFGLASDGYSHFTSPIRRYADLVVHRSIKAQLNGERSPLTTLDLDGLADAINDRGRDAGRAEGQARKALWLEHLAEELAVNRRRRYTALVCGAVARGLRVVIEGTGAVAVINWRALGGSGWEYRAGTATSAQGRRITVGDHLEVRIVRCDPWTLDCEAAPVDEPDRARQPRNGSGPRRSANGRRGQDGRARQRNGQPSRRRAGRTSAA